MDDDDFGDFGGFEAAEGVVPQEAQPLPSNLEAGSSPWALITGGLAAPSDETKVQAAIATTGKEDFADFQQFPGQAERSHELESSIPWSTPQSAHNEEPVESVSEVSKPTVQSEDLSAAPSVAVDTAHSASPPLVSNVELEGLKTDLKKSQDETSKLDKEIVELSTRLQTSQKETEELSRELAGQKEKYDTLQSKHNEELDGLRAAGHDALAVVVEEYKELCKVSVMQQQEMFQKELERAMKEEAEKCRKLLMTQEESFQLEMEKVRETMKGRIQEALDKQQETHVESLQEAIKEEQKKTEAAIASALDAERDVSKQAVETAVQEERDKTRKLLEEQREQMLHSMDKERQKCQAAFADAMEEERQKSQDCIRKSIADEQSVWEAKMKEAVDLAVEEARLKLKKHLEAEAVVRRRALAGTDILLEAARNQLDALLLTKPPEESLS